MRKRTLVLLLGVISIAVAVPPSASAEIKTGYASVNGLKMYYEIHGAGKPLVLLHGAYMSIDLMGEILPALAEHRRVIAIELQGHGRTADIDRPITYERMADDTAALLHQIGIEKTDVFGYSMGGGVGLQMAIRHPEMVNKLVAAAATYNSDGLYPEVIASIEGITPEAFANSPFEKEYQRLAPDPESWPVLIDKLKALDTAVQDWPAESIKAIKSPTLVIIGDSDIVRPEHAVEMFRLLGGGVPGDLQGLPNSQLAVLPGTMHLTLLSRPELLVLLIEPFLDAAVREAGWTPRTKRQGEQAK